MVCWLRSDMAGMWEWDTDQRHVKNRKTYKTKKKIAMKRDTRGHLTHYKS